MYLLYMIILTKEEKSYPVAGSHLLHNTPCDVHHISTSEIVLVSTNTQIRPTLQDVVGEIRIAVRAIVQIQVTEAHHTRRPTVPHFLCAEVDGTHTMAKGPGGGHLGFFPVLPPGGQTWNCCLRLCVTFQCGGGWRICLLISLLENENTNIIYIFLSQRMK